MGGERFLRGRAALPLGLSRHFSLTRRCTRGCCRGGQLAHDEGFSHEGRTETAQLSDRDAGKRRCRYQRTQKAGLALRVNLCSSF